MSQEIENSKGGGKQKTFYRSKYLSLEEVTVYTGLGQQTSDLLKEFSVQPVSMKGKEKYLKSEIDGMMFKFAS